MKTILVDAINTLVIKEEGIYEPLQDLLESYPNPKIILTNADDEQMKKFGLHDMPYEVFTLKHNPEKTDPSYFTQMLNHFNLTKDDVVYIEHNADAVQSAQSLGIPTHQYDPETKDVPAVQEFLNTHL